MLIKVKLDVIKLSLIRLIEKVWVFEILFPKTPSFEIISKAMFNFLWASIIIALYPLSYILIFSQPTFSKHYAWQPLLVSLLDYIIIGIINFSNIKFSRRNWELIKMECSDLSMWKPGVNIHLDIGDLRCATFINILYLFSFSRCWNWHPQHRVI